MGKSCDASHTHSFALSQMALRKYDSLVKLLKPWVLHNNPPITHFLPNWYVHRWVRSLMSWTLYSLFCYLHPYSTVRWFGPRSPASSTGLRTQDQEGQAEKEVRHGKRQVGLPLFKGHKLWVCFMTISDLESPPLCDGSRDFSSSCFLLVMLSFPSTPLLWPENGCANSWKFSENDFSWGLGTGSCFFSKDIEAHKSNYEVQSSFCDGMCNWVLC